MAFTSTRFRHISGKNLLEIEALVEALPFKIEHKQTIYIPNTKSFIIQFALPEVEGIEFHSIDL